MDNYLGLKLKLSLKDGSTASGTVDSINESTQKLSLTEVKFVAKGSREEVSFPELTILAKNIDDVEIISTTTTTAAAAITNKSNIGKSSFSKATVSKTAANKATVDKTSNQSVNNAKGANFHQSPHGTPSVYADKATTFPSGNARKNLPSEEFDFAANLARFDKANEFKKIQAEDLVPKADRLVSINSPQRKLGIHESVLEPREDKKAKDEIMEKFKHLTVAKSSPLLVEEGSEDDLNDLNDMSNGNRNDNYKKQSNNNNNNNNIDKDDNTLDIPMVSSVKFDKFIAKLDANGELPLFRSIGALNFAHHLLAELDASKDLALLLGVGEASAFLLESIYHLCNHRRLQMEIHAIFAAGAPGSAGKRIELSGPVKAARKKILSLDRVKFTTSLSDILKLNKNVVVFDALGHDGELTENASKGLSDWMRKLLSKSAEGGKPTVYGIESSILKDCPAFTSSASNTSLQLVTFGIARDTITPSLRKSKSIIYVDTGISGKTFVEEFGAPDLLAEIYSQSFVTELEYS